MWHPRTHAILVGSSDFPPRSPDTTWPTLSSTSASVSLQVLELTNVGLDDGMLKVLGEVFTSARVTSPSSSSTTTARRGGFEEDDDPDDIFSPSATPNGPACLGNAREQQERNGGGGEGGSSDVGATGVVSLRTLVLGHCGGVSEAGFEAFLEIAGGGGGMATPESSAKRASGTRNRNSGSCINGTSKTVGGGGAAAAAAEAAGSGTGGRRLELSTVRLQGCKALGDRGLAMLCAGAKERLRDIQVCGMCFYEDKSKRHGKETLRETPQQEGGLWYFRTVRAQCGTTKNMGRRRRP